MATTQVLTAEDLEAMASTNNRYELIRGELAPTSPTGGRHGKITVKLSTPLAVHVCLPMAWGMCSVRRRASF